MKHALLLLLTYVALVVQTSIVPELAVAGCRPQLLVLALLAALRTCGGTSAIVWAAILGLISDAIAPDRLGIDLILFTLTAAAVERFARRQPPLSIVGLIVTTFSASLAIGFSSAAARLLLRGVAVDPIALSQATAGSAACTALLAVFIVAAGRLLHTTFRHRTPQPGGVNRWWMLTE